MALIDRTQGRRIDIPHEPGEWLSVRRLTWEEIASAKSIKQSQTFRDITVIGSEAMKQLEGMTSESIAQALADPLAQLDIGTVLTHGVVGWSYSADVTPENVKLLDEATAKFAALEIVQPQSEEQRKNGSSVSTEPSTETESLQTNG